MSADVNQTERTIEALAVDWVIRVRSPEFTDWDGLTDWIAADARHAEHFDRLTLIDDALGDDIAALAAMEKAETQRLSSTASRAPGSAPAYWMKMAAGLLLPVVLAGSWFALGHLQRRGPPDAIAFQTGPGEHRNVTLADGTRMALGGSTRVVIEAGERHARLVLGRATFRVVHDPQRPFSIDMGELNITDVGTTFDLHRWEKGSEVAVAEGRIRLAGRGAQLEVPAGRMVRSLGDGALRVLPVAVTDVGSWQRGRLSYADTTLAAMAADLEAETGTSIRVEPAVAMQHFAGSIQVGDGVGRTLHGLAPLLGASVRKKGAVWELVRSDEADQR